MIHNNVSSKLSAWNIVRRGLRYNSLAINLPNVTVFLVTHVSVVVTSKSGTGTGPLVYEPAQNVVKVGGIDIHAVVLAFSAKLLSSDEEK